MGEGGGGVGVRGSAASAGQCKADIAQASETCQARIAEAKILGDKEIAQARAAGGAEKCKALEERLAIDIRRAEEDREAKKRKIRVG